MKVVSDRLNCRANACMVSESNAAPFSKTHNGFPVSAPWRCVNTLTMRNGWVAISAEVYVRPAPPAARTPRGPYGRTTTTGAGATTATRGP